jgi:hypothetical protein
MGLSLHNSQAVWEGFSGKKSPFIRTPKFNLESSAGNWTTNTYKQITIPFSTYIEGLMALVFMIMVFLAFYFQTYEMIVFHLMLAIGFGLVSISSFNSYKKTT